MGVTGRSDSLGLHILLGTLLTQLSQGAAELVCPEIGLLDSPANLSCIGAGRTHSYTQPSGGVVTTCNMTTTKCLPDAMVTIPNSSFSVLTLPRVNQSHAGNWNCSIGAYVSGCFMTVAKPPSCDILSSQVAEEMTVRVQDYHCSDSIELYLKTGNFTGRLLNTSRIKTTVGMFEITVNVTTSLVETKTLVFVCGNTSWEIACRVEAEESNGSNSSVVIIGAAAAGSVFVIIIVMLVVILVKLKQSKRKQQPETQTDNCVNDSTYDVMGHNGKSNEDVHKPSACYDRVYILHAGCTASPEGDTSIYDVASR